MQKHIYISLIVGLMAFIAPIASGATVQNVDFKQKTYSAASDYTRLVQRKISASEAKSIARKKVRGAEVIDISLQGKAYKVRMQKKNGHVVDVYVDAATGRVR